MTRCWMIALAALPATAAFARDSTEVGHVPLLGEKAPAFQAVSTQGPVKFPEDYKGKWLVLFSHPGAFSPVCTTEFIVFAQHYDAFKARNCELLGLSVGSLQSHLAWLRTIEEKIEYKGMKRVAVGFPVIADSLGKVAAQYGMLQPAASSTATVRAVFVIDPNGIVRAMLYYPMTTGRNIDEILRLVIALQTADENQVATPADWQPGDEVIVPTPPTLPAVDARAEKPDKEYHCLDWFLCLKKLEAKK